MEKENSKKENENNSKNQENIKNNVKEDNKKVSNKNKKENNTQKNIEKKEFNKDIIEETINERKKLPKDLKDKISNIVFFNVIIFMLMMVITLSVNIMFDKFSLLKFENIMKIIQILVSLITIALFEYSYKKDSFKSSLYGIEFFLYSIAILYVPYMYTLNNINFLETIIIIFGIYYIVKSIITFIYYKNKYLKENMSDVKEIVKEEKRGYLDD